MLKPLESRTHSSGTLLRGAAIIGGDSMNLEGDDQYEQMKKEHARLMETCLYLPLSSKFFISLNLHLVPEIFLLTRIHRIS